MFTLPSDNPPDVLLGIDLGRHQARAVLSSTQGSAEVIRLGSDREAMVLRTLVNDRPARVFDEVRRLMGSEIPGAGRVLREVAELLAARLEADGVRIAGVQLRLSVPTGQTRRETELICTAFDGAGFRLADIPVVPRAVAAVAGFAGHVESPTGAVVVVDNDAGVVSTASADLDRFQLGPARILFDATASRTETIQRLRASLGAHLPEQGVVWLKTGGGAARPEIDQLCAEVAPWPQVSDPMVPAAAWQPVSGLLESVWLGLLVPETIDDIEPQLSRQP